MTLSALLPHRSKEAKLQVYVPAAIGCITVLTLFQDLVEAFINQFPFYFSEALLFKTTWMLFFPFLLLQRYFLSKIDSDVLSLKKITSTVLPLTLHLVFIPLVIWSVSAVFFDHTYSFAGTFEYTLSEDLYKLVLGYCLLPLVAKKKGTLEQSPLAVTANTSKEPDTIEKIKVSNGKTYTLINVTEIQYISAATPYIAIHAGNKNYLDTGTLKSMQAQLDKRTFIRIHKSAIVNIRYVKFYTSRSNGDYDLTLNNGALLRLSRNFAPDFKTALEAGTQVSI